MTSRKRELDHAFKPAAKREKMTHDTTAEEEIKKLIKRVRNNNDMTPDEKIDTLIDRNEQTALFYAVGYRTPEIERTLFINPHVPKNESKKIKSMFLSVFKKQDEATCEAILESTNLPEDMARLITQYTSPKLTIYGSPEAYEGQFRGTFYTESVRGYLSYLNSIIKWN